MNAKEICHALFVGLKVGTSPDYYIYLNDAGDLRGHCDPPRYSFEEPTNILSNLIYYGNAQCLPKEGE
jgi:hypothetical protein